MPIDSAMKSQRRKPWKLGDARVTTVAASALNRKTST
jgi:hypothetical protein